jgi:glycosyltransferase involved in cell wall biosynthesis
VKILFVLSGNKSTSSIDKSNETFLIKNAKHQGDFLIKLGYKVDYFLIKGKGIWGYSKNIPKIRKCIKNGKYDIVHAHYSFSGIATSFAGNRNLVVSLMGSDSVVNPVLLLFIRILCKYYWKVVIVKSESIKSRIKLEKAIVLPNGVDIDKFKPMNKIDARKYLNLPKGRLILFASDPARPEKNFKLAQEAFTLLDVQNKILLPVYNVPHEEMPYYMNAADVLLLTSKWEGSVNVIKEAMACNTPAVSTDVGDVRINTKNLSGYYLTSMDPIDVSQNLAFALNHQVSIHGVERIKELELDAVSVSKKLIKIYESLIKK